MLTAYEAFEDILDINETIEMLKEKNNGKTPDKTLCQSIRLLTGYRDLLGVLMARTHLIADEKP